MKPLLKKSACCLSLLLLTFLFFGGVTAFALEKGTLFPPLPGLTLDGEMFNIAKLEGQPLILTIGTTWCPSCNTLRHKIVKISPFLKKNGIRTVDVFINSNAERVRRYFAKNNIPLPDTLLLDKRAFSKSLAVRFIPRLILIDKNFKVYRDGLALSASALRQELEKMVAIQ